jgi:hypothetical protein
LSLGETGLNIQPPRKIVLEAGNALAAWKIQ